MANPARLISIDDHPLFSDLEYHIFNDPISRTNSLSGDSDVPTLAETIIFHTPPEIIDQILTYLPLEDKACFIITCSHYYPRYKSFLEGGSLRECRPLDISDHNPFLMKRPKKIYSKVDVDARPKAKLLRRLENDRWKFCLDCWKLHLTSQSTANTDTDSDSDPETDKDSPEEQSCMQRTGVIKFCPCVDLTPTDCKNLNTSLMAMKTDEWEDSEKYYQELFDLACPNNYWNSDDGKDDDDDNHFSLYHYCPSEAWLKNHPFK